MVSLICFRYWEFLSLGSLEDVYDLFRNSQSPNLPAAKAITVILMFIPARSAGGGLHGQNTTMHFIGALPETICYNRGHETDMYSLGLSVGLLPSLA
jgi:hypothetical protein